MVAASDCKKNTKLIYRKEPHVVIDFQHFKPGKGGAFIRIKMRNLITGLIVEDTFRPEEKFESPDLGYRTMQYLYKDEGRYCFMDQDSFEQEEINEDKLTDVLDYLKEQTDYTMLYWGERLIGATPPLHLVLEVTDTPPGVRGDTAQGGGTKPATLETGLVVQVPLFVNIGDTVKVDTRDGKYIERVQK